MLNEYECRGENSTTWEGKKKKKGWAASTKEKEKYNGESMEIKDHVKRNM